MSSLNRRAVLRGAGVALCLPAMESLAPRIAHANTTRKRRYISLYFPNGTAAYWRPSQAGDGAAWRLSPILEPLAPVKKHVTVLTGMSNYSTFGLPDGPAGRLPVNPAHSNLCAATFTCAPARDASGRVVRSGPTGVNSGISVDQIIANAIGEATPLASMQVGLSTRNSSLDNLPAQHSRSISWKSPSQPLFKVVNPQAVFDRLVAGRGAGMGLGVVDANEAKRRQALRKSALDAVLDVSQQLKRDLGREDQTRLDEFMTSVRSLEARVAAPEMQVAAGACSAGPRPPYAAAVGQTPPGYNRGHHASLMIDLTVMALRCDITRVVSFMLDDAASTYVYSFLRMRSFSSGGSTAGSGTAGEFHGASHSGVTHNGYATIGHWMAEKAAELSQKLEAVPDGGGRSLLDNTVITFCSGMNGPNHDGRMLPVALIGSGGGVFKTDRHVVYPSDQRLADLHLTIIQKVFGINLDKFGASRGILQGLLA